MKWTLVERYQTIKAISTWLIDKKRT